MARTKKTGEAEKNRIIESIREDFCYPEEIATAMLASPMMRASGNYGSNEDFLDDVGADDVVSSARKLFPHLEESEKRTLAAHVLAACYKAYAAGIMRAKDEMQDAI